MHSIKLSVVIFTLRFPAALWQEIQSVALLWLLKKNVVSH